MKPWQHGYEIEKLREYAAPFLRDFKPHVYGAFGLPKERDVALALKAGEFAYTLNKDYPGHVAAAAIFKKLSSGSRSQDFTGRTFCSKAGDLSIKAVAGWERPEIVTRLINGLCERAGGGTCWLEVFEEIPGAQQLLKEMGFRYLGTKIAASSDLRGVYLRGNDRERIPKEWLPPEELVGLKTLAQVFISEDERASILREIQEYEAQEPWAQHYSNYNKRKSWTAFALNGYSRDPAFIVKPSEMSMKWKQSNESMLSAPCAATAAWDHFPFTTSLLSRFPGKGFQRVRFMRLSKSGGELSRHADITDPEAGTGSGKIARLHLPLQTESACVFRSWGLRGGVTERHLQQGGLYYLDTRKPHQVLNGGALDRIHLVVDVVSDSNLREMLCQ